MTKISTIACALALTFSNSPARADQIQLIPNGKLALSVWSKQLSEAQRSIDIATYSFNPCSSSGKLIEGELVKKVASGVRVRMLVDGMLLNDETRSSFAYEMGRKGIAVRFYNNAALGYSPLSNMRSHAKFAVIDSSVLITGGRNLDDPYFGLDQTLNFVDRDLVLKGDTAKTAHAAFQELWDSQLADTLAEPSAGDLATYRATCAAPTSRDAAVRSIVARDGGALTSGVLQVSCANAEFVLDHPDFPDVESDGGEYLSGMRYQRKVTTKTIVDFIAGARHSLSIENWLYIPAHNVDSALEERRTHRVAIEVFTNLTSDADHVAGVSRFYQLRDNADSQKVIALANVGALRDSWELSPAHGSKWFLHAKAMVRDSTDVVVSSFNLDPRSYATNLESAVIVRNCPELAAKLHEQMLAHYDEAKSDRSCGACQASDPGPAPSLSQDWWLLELL